VYTIKEKGGNPDKKTTLPLLYGLRNFYRIPELLRLCPENSTKLYVHELGFRTIEVKLCTVPGVK
jgi:hypothetical protein